MSWRELAPGPGSLWVRWTPRRWPAPGQPRLDAVARRLRWPGAATGSGAPPCDPVAPPRPDLTQLPFAAAAEAARLASTLAAAGSPALVALDPGEAIDLPESAVRVWDPLPWLLESVDRGIERLADCAPPGGRLWVVLPLLPGLWRDAAELERLIAAAAVSAPEVLLPVAPELEPTDRRRLAETLGEDRFEAVFHREPPSERHVAAMLAARGLDWRPARPRLPGLSPRMARNRELAAALSEASELWLRLGRAEPEGLALAAAARHLDGSALDLASIAREGNLDVLEWLPPPARSLVAGLVESGRSTLLEELAAAWCAPSSTGAT